MPNPSRIARILVFDSMDKYNLLKEWTKHSRSLTMMHCASVEVAMSFLEKQSFDILLIGGNPNGEQNGITLVGRLLLERGATAFPYTYITTWDDEEARILRKLLFSTGKPGAIRGFYCPFSQSLVTLLLSKSRKIRAQKALN